MKRKLLILLAMFLFSGALKTQCFAAEMKFSDVKKEYWYYDSVSYVYENNIMKGLRADFFGANETVSRAQAITILYRMSGSPDVTVTASFKDVSASAWYAKAAEWGKEAGIITGYGDGTFKGARPVTREQFCAMFYRYEDKFGTTSEMRSFLNVFSDFKKVTSYAVTPVNWAVARGLIKGNSRGNYVELSPQNSLKRADCSMILMRYLEDEVKDGTVIAAYNMQLNNASAVYAEKVLQEFSKRGIEIAGLQEINPSWETYLRNQIGGTTYKLLTTGQNAYNHTGIGMIYNAAKYALKQVRGFSLYDEKTFDHYNTVRYCVASEFEDPYGHNFAVLSVHLEWTDLFANAEQALEVKKLVDQLRANHVPVYICGDFNNVYPMYLGQQIFINDYKNTVGTDLYFNKEEEIESLSTGSEDAVNSVVKAFKQGGITIDEGNGPVTYELSIDMLGLEPDAEDSEIQAAVRELFHYKLDNIYYSEGDEGYYVTEMTDSVENELFPNSSDHNIVYARYITDYIRDSKANLLKAIVPAHMKEKSVN